MLSCAHSLLGWTYASRSPKRTQDHLHGVDNYDDPNIDFTAFVIEDESPYVEVRSAVANTDDPMMLSSTIRAWVVGLIWAIIISGTNQFFSFRYPSTRINQVCLSVIVESLCVLFAESSRER
jgi:OPT oligopeptide transporter protein